MSTKNPPTITSLDIDPAKYSIANLEALREIFPSLPDETLARYLIARNNNLQAAMEQLRKAEKIKLDLFPVFKSSCINEMRTGKVFAHGFDKEGRPLLVWNSRLHITKERNLEETGRLLIWWAEYTIRRQFPADKSKFTVLIDRTGFSQDNADMELIRQTAGSFQDLYPERMYRCIIYPSDFLFYALWNIAKWFLDPVTRNKVQPVLTFGGVEQFVDRQYIPASMGGDSTFVFNADSFEDPYTPEEMEQMKKQKEGGGEDSTPFLNPIEPMSPTTESERVAKVKAEETLKSEGK